MSFRWPHASADRLVLTATDLANPVYISNIKTVIVLSALTGNVTLNLTLDPRLPEGSELKIEVTQGASARNVTLGTGFSGSPNLSGASASDVDFLSLDLSNGSFKATQPWLKIVQNAPVVNPGLDTWVTNAGAGDAGYTSVAYGNGTYVAVGTTTVFVMTSPDGKTWTARTAAENNQWRSVCYSPTLGLFCAVAISGTNRVMTSPDGITWTARAAAAANQWAAVCWGGGQFVAVAISGTGNRAMTSPDGINWTIRTSAADLQWFGIDYGAGQYIAVAAGSTANVNKFMKSSDGITWTPFQQTTQQFLGIKYVTFLSLWVVAAGDGAGGRVLTSPDGTTFTARSVPGTAVQWEKLDFSGSLVCMIGSTTGTDRIATSPDGINWTLQTTPAANGWLGICYGNNRFVAVANTGTGNRVMTSPG